MRTKKVKIIAQHEFRSIVHTKTFLIVTILGPLLIFAVTVLPSLLTRGADDVQEGKVIAVYGASNEVMQALQEAFFPQGVSIAGAEDLESYKEELLNNDALQGVVEIAGDITKIEHFTYYSKSGTDYTYSQMISSIIGNIAVAARLEDAGYSQEEFRELSRVPHVIMKKITSSGESEGEDMFTVIMTAISFIMLLYMSTLLYGQMIGRSVVTEKTSKTVEVLLSSARPTEIMAGKIIGIGSAGILQYLIWISAALIIQIVFRDLSLPSSFSITTLILLFLFFIAAFALYASIYAALGAAAENEQNLGQLAWPLIIFLVIPMVMISNFVMNPGSALSLILSYFPMTSPMVMFIRVMVDTPSGWELLLCFAILLASIAGAVWVSSRIFRVGILLTGKKGSIKEIMKWIRYR